MTRLVLACCLLACVVGAKEATTAEKLAEIRKMEAEGDPLIISYAKALQAEVAAAQDVATTTYNNFFEGMCATALQDMSYEIERAKANITALDTNIEVLTNEMKALADSIPAKREIVDGYPDQIQAKETDLAGLKALRDTDHATYQEEMQQGAAAINMLDEIRDYIQQSNLDTTAPQSGDATGSFMAPSFVQQAALLETAMKTATGLKLQLMKTAQSALLGGAVDSLYDILYKMRVQFTAEMELLTANEDAAFESWEAARMDARDEIGDLLIAMESMKEEISNVHTAMAQAEAQIADDNILMAHERKHLNRAGLELEKRNKECSDTKANYEAETARNELTQQNLASFITDTEAAIAADPAWWAPLNDGLTESTLGNAPADHVAVDENYKAKSGSAAVSEAMVDLTALATEKGVVREETPEQEAAPAVPAPPAPAPAPEGRL